MRERKLNRLPGYDYSTPGAYFITINIKYQDRIFGKIDNGQMILSEYGVIADQQWKWLFGQYPYLGIDEYIVMPDHFHGIIHILPSSYEGKIKPIPELIGAFKTTSSKQIHLAGAKEFQWHKSYHDRIIRDNDELERIREYIRNNPGRIERDQG